MPIAVLGGVTPPLIEALGNTYGQSDRIPKSCLIQITTDNPLHKIYFTTDASTPDAFNRSVNGREVTHKYKAPFGLKVGRRYVRAVAYTRNGKLHSEMSSRVFDVVHTETDLSLIGEEDEDGCSTARSAVRGVGYDDPGSARYMERLTLHLDGTLDNTCPSEIDFESPHSIREILNGIETPHTVRDTQTMVSDHLKDRDLSSVEWRRLQELEADHRRPTSPASCRDCDDGRSHITDFFYSTNGRHTSSNNEGGRYNEPFSRSASLPSGSGQVYDSDYGITGVTKDLRSDRLSSLPRQERAIPEYVSCGTKSVDTADYRRQVDRELMERVRAGREQTGYTQTGHTQTGYTEGYTQHVVSTTDSCDECRACPECVGQDPGYRHPDHYTHHTSLVRREPRVSPRRGRSPRRAHTPPGILKRGRSLERARSRERQRHMEGQRRSRSRSLSQGRSPSRGWAERQERPRSRSRSPGHRYEGNSFLDYDQASSVMDPPLRSRYETSSDYDTDLNTRSRSRDEYKSDLEVRGRTREDLEVRGRSREDREVRGRSGEDREVRGRSGEDREVRGRSGEDREVRGRSRRDNTKMSLEEIDVRLSHFEDSDSSTNRKREDKHPKRGRAPEVWGVSEKTKKDSANQKRSSQAKKKPTIERPPSPSSSSVSSLSSTSSEDEGRKKDNSSEKKTKPKKASSKAIVPKDVKSDQPAAKDQAAKKKAEGALNFVNDSGTQINFWGVTPEEIAKKLSERPELRQAAEAVREAAGVGADNETEDDEVDQFFITQPRKNTAVKLNNGYFRGDQASRQSQAHSEYCADEDDGPGSVVEPVGVGQLESSPVRQAQQQQQHSFFSNIGEKVKGFFGKDSKPKPVLKKVNHEEIKKKCRKSKKPWEDPDFPTEDSSLFHTNPPQSYPVEWKRPHEICKDPQFIVDGASRFDVKQGVLGNCWLLAAVASLAGQERLLYRVIQPEQSFKKDYAGIFRFQFWQYGEWVDVCVDDRLPTKAGRLIYMHSAQQNEFWSPLLEKAYAKLNGCYENLSGGLTSEAMTDFTGGLTETFNFKEDLPDNMFQILLKARERGSLMGCSIDASPDHMEEQLETGLIIGHAYSITDVKQVTGEKGDTRLVRVRNPWGNHCEWNGAWSDSSKEWQSLPEKTRKKMGITIGHDGEFWMSARDFTTHFQRVEICNQDRYSSGAWESTAVNGAWVRKVSAGGCRNFPDTYPTNPQFRVEVTDPDDDDEEDLGTVILALMQKERRRAGSEGGGNLTIGYDIYQVDSKAGRTLDKKYFAKHDPVASSPQYINMREVTGRHRLPPGIYAVMPTTFEANEEAGFHLRIYSEKQADLAESDIPTSVNTKIAAKNMAVAHSAPGEQRKSRLAEEEFSERAGDNHELDAYELQAVLNTFSHDFSPESFSINSCRGMVAIRDKDATGMLGLEEFKSLWNDLVLWKQIFHKHDKDKSGFFSSFELREALKYVGYNVSNVTFKNIVMRYSDQEGQVQFQDFVDCIVRLKNLFEIHDRAEKDGADTMPIDKFIQTLMYT